MEKDFKNYQVIETDGMSAEQLQKILNAATDDLLEKQIEHVIGTKIIMSYSSPLTKKGRTEIAIQNIGQAIAESTFKEVGRAQKFRNAAR